MDIITVSFETVTAATGVVVSGTVSSAGADLVPGNNTSVTPPFDVSTLSAPLAPTQPVAAPRDRAVRLAFVPVPNPAPDIVDYAIEYSRDGGATWQRVDDGVSTATSVTITGLRNGVSYVFRVAGVNAAGTGAWSAASDPVRPSRPPAAPTHVMARAGNRSVTVTWRAPHRHGGSPVTDYVIQYSTTNGRTWVTVADRVSISTRATITGLRNGTSYRFRVAAVNGAGRGSFSAASGSVRPRARS
jgi:predicted phage tail protein